MPNPFKDWARMNRATKQYLESQRRPSSCFGQMGDIPNRMHERADTAPYVAVDPRNQMGLAIDWIRTGRFG